MNEIAPGVAVLPIGIANVYFVGDPGRAWLLVDTGMPKNARKISAAAEVRFGPGARPEAIILTHGHFDHAGSAFDLAIAWDVPIYAHRLEMPYLAGKALYPPADPTVGGPLGFLTRFFRAGGQDLRPCLRELPEDGHVPGLSDWRWLPTPGHSPGHVSLYQESDRTLLAGDACTTVNMDSLAAILTKTQELSRPPAPITCDWDAAHRSVRSLAALKPAAIACGHGEPMCGPDVASPLTVFAENFPVPANGRYVTDPAITDENGIVSLPPPPPDPLRKQIAVAAALAAVVAGALALTRRRGLAGD